MRILLAEDDSRVASFVRRGLREEQYAVDIAADGEKALFMAQTVEYDLIILDLMLPQKDGLEILRTLRGSKCNTAVLILTAKDKPKDKVEGLNAGADDYLTKPFGFEELLARVRALLRRRGDMIPTVLAAGDLQMDVMKHRVRRGGKDLDLTNREYDLLEFFLRHPNEVVTRTKLSEHVWEADFDTFSNVIDVHIARLRQKINDGFSPKLLETVRGKGYILQIPRNRMIRSIRFSLTLWYAALLIVILSLFGGVLYTNVRANLARDIDRLLVSEADGIGDAVTSFGKAELEAKNLNIASQDKIAEIFLENIAHGELPALVGRWAEVTDELDTVRPVRIVSKKGETLAFSPSLSNWVIPVNARALQGTSAGKTLYETYRVADGHRVRIATYPILEKGSSLFFVQVAISLLQTDASLERLRSWLLWLIPLTAILASLIGWFLASLALRPVGKMVREARQMSESRLHQRIEVPKTGDELQKLGQTFNEMLDRFERGFKRLRQFSAAASHELRTPLTVMKGEMELVLRKSRTDEEYKRVLRNQLNVVNDMAHVVEQLLAVAHAEDGELAVQWEVLELEVLIRSVAQSFDQIVRAKNISLQVTAERSVQVQGERRLLERLIANLLENAIKHTPPEGRVTLEAVGLGGQSLLIVRDTGEGILAEELPKIFDKFFKPQHSSEGIPSTGIGLGLCRWIAEVHRGKIEVASIPGQGAEFTVSFPASGA